MKTHDVGYVHNVNNAALWAADLTFVFLLLTTTGYSESQRETGSKRTCPTYKTVVYLYMCSWSFTFITTLHVVASMDTTCSVPKVQTQGE